MSNGFNTFLTGLDTLQSRMARNEERQWHNESVEWRRVDEKWREEDRSWREEDRDWRAEDRDWRLIDEHFMSTELLWREEDLVQRHLDNARVMWSRCVEKNRRDVEERAEQLKAISNLSALISGFAVVAFLEFSFPKDPSQLLAAAFAFAVACTVGLMITVMMMCTLMHASIVKMGKTFVNEEAEAEYIHGCFHFIRNFEQSQGLGPPAPARTFENHWMLRCEQGWGLSYRLFSLGIVSFLISLVLAAWIKFEAYLAACILVTIALSSALLGFFAMNAQWANSLFSQGHTQAAAFIKPRAFEAVGLPFDWHLPSSRPSAGRPGSTAPTTSTSCALHPTTTGASALEAAWQPLGDLPNGSTKPMPDRPPAEPAWAGGRKDEEGAEQLAAPAPAEPVSSEGATETHAPFASPFGAVQGQAAENASLDSPTTAGTPILPLPAGGASRLRRDHTLPVHLSDWLPPGDANPFQHPLLRPHVGDGLSAPIPDTSSSLVMTHSRSVHGALHSSLPPGGAWLPGRMESLRRFDSHRNVTLDHGTHRQAVSPDTAARPTPSSAGTIGIPARTPPPPTTPSAATFDSAPVQHLLTGLQVVQSWLWPSGLIDSDRDDGPGPVGEGYCRARASMHDCIAWQAHTQQPRGQGRPPRPPSGTGHTPHPRYRPYPLHHTQASARLPPSLREYAAAARCSARLGAVERQGSSSWAGSSAAHHPSTRQSCPPRPPPASNMAHGRADDWHYSGALLSSPPSPLVGPPPTSPRPTNPRGCPGGSI